MVFQKKKSAKFLGSFDFFPWVRGSRFGDFHNFFGCHRPPSTSGVHQQVLHAASTSRPQPIRHAPRSWPIEFCGVWLWRCSSDELLSAMTHRGPRAWVIFRYLRNAIREILVDYMTNLMSIGDNIEDNGERRVRVSGSLIW